MLSIDDELIVYTSKVATQFSGCQRGAFGTVAATHQNGAAVKANMVAGFLTALQSAVVAIENDLGTAAARGYVRRDGVVTITGMKTFVDGAEFGAGTKAATGLVRLPNAGAVKWRKQDGSGDLGLALGANNHVQFDAIIDFAPGQTFGAFSYPDATTTSKGIVQIDPVGGLAVTAGVLSLQNSGVAAGQYTKVTVDAKGRVTGGASLASPDLPPHTHVAGDIVSGSLPFAIQKAGVAQGIRRALNLIEGLNVTLTVADDPANDRVNVTVGMSSTSVPAHTHVIGDVSGLRTELDLRPARGPGWVTGRAVVINASGSLEAAVGAASDCVLVDGTSAAKANAVHTHAIVDVTNLQTTLDDKASASHTHAQSQVTNLVTDLASKASKAGDTFTGALRLEGDQSMLHCGPYQTVGGAFENMAKFSEDFSVGTWDKSGGSCTVTTNAATAPDGNATADQINAATATPVLQQQIAGLVSGGTYTFYVWARVASGTRKVSLGIVDNAYAAYLAGPTQVTLTTAWQRFKITGALAAGQTGLWVVVRQHTANGDDWTTGAIHLWGACLQQGNDPKKGYARTWASQTVSVAAGIASGPVVIAAGGSSEAPLRVYGPNSNLADKMLFGVNEHGEVTIAGRNGNGYMLSELMGATNPSGWSGVLKVKNPAGVTAGYILLYSNP